MTNPFQDRTIKEIEREVLKKKDDRCTFELIEVLPIPRAVRITGEED